MSDLTDALRSIANIHNDRPNSTCNMAANELERLWSECDRLLVLYSETESKLVYARGNLRARGRIIAELREENKDLIGELDTVTKALTEQLAAKERECERLRELYRAERSKMGAWFRHKAETEANIKAAAGGEGK